MFLKIDIQRLLIFCAGVSVVVAAGCSTATTNSETAPRVAASTVADFGDSNSETQWSGWRGASLHGVSRDAQLPLKWDVNVGVRWSAPIPGRGNSSPVLWDDDVFLSTVAATEAGEQLAVLCISRDDGAVQWRRDLGPPQGPTHQKNGHASATIATDGRRVFAFFGANGLFCFDVDGRQQWHVPLAGLEQQWGAASSPLLVGDSVVQLCDGPRGSFIAAYNQVNGKLVWQTPRAGTGSWSSPVLMKTTSDGQDHVELIVNGSGAADGAEGTVCGYDPADGRELWRVSGSSDITCPTAIVGAGVIVSSSGGNGPVFAIRPGGSGDVTNSHVAWKRHSGGPYVPTGMIYQDRLYTISDGGVLSCFNPVDGTRTWKRRLSGTFSASLVAGAGRIYATSEAGDVYVLSAGDQFELLATNRMKERCLATPALVRGEIFLRTEDRLYCIADQASEVTINADALAVPVLITSPSDTGRNSESPVPVSTPSDVLPTGDGGE